MKTWLTMLCACLALGLGVAGCGGDDDDDGGSSAADTTADQPVDKPTDTAEKPDKADKSGGGKKGVPVAMRDIAYNPPKLTVAKGKTVTWTNHDHVEHDVTKLSGPGKDFKSDPSGGIEPGDSYSYTFKTPGKITYQCTVHPGMEGTVTVK